MAQYKFCPECGLRLLKDKYCTHCRKSFGKKPRDYTILRKTFWLILLIVGSFFVFRWYFLDPTNLLKLWVFFMIFIIDGGLILYFTHLIPNWIKPDKYHITIKILTFIMAMLFATFFFLFVIVIEVNIIINIGFTIGLIVFVIAEAVVIIPTIDELDC